MRQQIIDEFNTDHAVVMLGGKCVIMNEYTNPITRLPDVRFSSFADFKRRYENRFMEERDSKGQIKKVPTTEVWLKAPDRQQFDDVIFSPSGNINGCYNLWRGFAATPRRGDWGLMRDHIHMIVCNGNDTYFEYFLNWAANLVKNPGRNKPGVSIVLMGGIGFGKGVVVEFLGSLFGSHYKHIKHPGQLTGRFNSLLKDAYLVYADEVTWGGDNQAAGVLKGLITESSIQIELKGKDIFEVKNHVSLIIASNSDWVIPAGLNERRFFVLNLASSRAQDTEYFAAIRNQMNNGGREAMLYDLLERNLTGVNLRLYPRTSALTDQIMRSLSHAGRFWFHYIQNCYCMEEIAVTDFHSTYIHWAKAQNERYRMDTRQLGRELRKLCPSIRRRLGEQGTVGTMCTSSQR